MSHEQSPAAQLFVAKVRMADEPGERVYAVRSTTSAGAMEELRTELGREAFNRAAVSLMSVHGSKAPVWRVA